MTTVLYIDFGKNAPCCGIVLDGHGIAIMVPDVLRWMLEWERNHILAYCAYRGWTVNETEDEA